MPREFDVVVEQHEDGYYVGSVPTLPGCHTQARSLDELMVRVREAIAVYLEAEDIPEERLNFRRHPTHLRSHKLKAMRDTPLSFLVPNTDSGR